MAFASFDLHPDLLRGVAATGFTVLPPPILHRTIERTLRTPIERATLHAGSLRDRRADGQGRPDVRASLSERRGYRARSGVGG
jgi:hypothetical protein